MCGKEFCNAYTELNDPFEQRLRFEDCVACGARYGDDKIAIPVRRAAYGVVMHLGEVWVLEYMHSERHSPLCLGKAGRKVVAD